MNFLRIQSLATAAIFAMAGKLFFAAEAVPQGGSPAQQAQPAAARPAANAEGRQGLGATAPVPSPRLDDVSSVPIFPAEQVTGFSIAQPAPGNAAPPSRTPQNRALSPNAGNAAHTLPGEAAYSPNWLVDGMARLEADEKQQRAANARDGKTGDADDVDPLTGKPARHRDLDINADDRYGTAAAANDPLVQYLQKWMETSSGAAAAAVMAQPSDSSDGQYQANPPADAAVAGPSIPLGTQHAPDSSRIAAQMTQPMLEATGPSIVRPPPPIPQTGAAQNAMPATDASPRPDAGMPANAVLKIKSIEPDPEPTKPILNDKKYFPQMQRF